ncbi:hypothetical protein KY285_007624 [Solanum tuberosum]|nr:hypothetical protein KY289_009564 [Solanum tuberosum]KAH0745967.1 hypothetical protein KY285_007624 [Solanum tuberosum]
MAASSEFAVLCWGFSFCWSEFGIITIWVYVTKETKGKTKGVVGSGYGEGNDFGAWWWMVCSGGVSDGFGSGLRRKGKELLGFGGGLAGFQRNSGDLPENN